MPSVKRYERVSARTAHPFDAIPDLPCRDVNPDLFFADSHAARPTCYSCPIRIECLAWALETHQVYGMWGGVGENERARMTKPQRASVFARARPFDQLADIVAVEQAARPVDEGLMELGRAVRAGVAHPVPFPAPAAPAVRYDLPEIGSLWRRVWHRDPGRKSPLMVVHKVDDGPTQWVVLRYVEGGSASRTRNRISAEAFTKLYVAATHIQQGEA